MLCSELVYSVCSRRLSDCGSMEKVLSLHDKAILNCVFNPSLPLDEAYQIEVEEELKDEEDTSPDLEMIKKKELNAVRKAEEKDYVGALEVLNSLISQFPSKASLYNNRAQVYQFTGDMDGALTDLATAIEKASCNQMRTLCQALCQRGLIHRKREQFDSAREDFGKAAELGSKFAKIQLVEMNPYAAMCNQMLQKVMADLQ